MNKKRAVVLLSGGLDSSTVLYYAKKAGYDCHCLIFDYGQRHTKELKSAVKIAKLAKAPSQIVKIKLPWGGSSLLPKEINVPRGSKSEIFKALPATYVPGRNTIFISFALSYAETINAGTIFIGANAIDYSGYPDCRPVYYKAWNGLLKSLGGKTSIKIPLLDLSKADIVKLGARLGVPFNYTWSCYAGGKSPCGKCDSCKFRAQGFKEAGVADTAGLIPLK